MNIRQLNPYSSLTCLIESEGSDEVRVLDPVLEHVQDDIEVLDVEKPRLIHVIKTHRHVNHISGVAAPEDLTYCGYILHRNAAGHCITHRVIDGYEIACKCI